MQFAKKKPLARMLIVAGAFAAGAGLAQAETFDVPQQAGEASTMTQGAPNLLTTNSPHGDHVVLYSSPAVVASSSGPTTQSWMNADGSTTYLTTETRVMGAGPAVVVTPAPHVHYGPMAAETSNVPLRAGEATTMTGGVPNMLTQNQVTIESHAGPVYWYGY